MIFELLDKTFPTFEGEFSDEKLFQSFNRYRILSPMRRGIYGTTALNQAILNHYETKAGYGSFMKIPIMINRNDYAQGLFNGETGILIKKRSNNDRYAPPFDEEDYALFPGESESTFRRVPALLLPPFEYGYCLSVHKSQGSEFDHVLLLLPEGSEQFGR